MALQDLTPVKQDLLSSSGNLLVRGGPGSGKTTIALLKAEQDIRDQVLGSGQRVLFLSFARATVARLLQACDSLNIDSTAIEINTYHGFAWSVIRSHGYLLGPTKRVRLLPPPDAAARLSGIKASHRQVEIERLFAHEGLLHFDLFARNAAAILTRSRSLSQIFSAAYPIIVLDEFQDTDHDEWDMIRAMGQRSRLIALCDPDQRIYEFRGADPSRINEFIDVCNPRVFDFGMENHRSQGTDICNFGNDLLSGSNRAKTYNDVKIIPYRMYHGKSTHYSLKTELLKGIRRQERLHQHEWSVAVLVPSKKLMLSVSDYLSHPSDGLPVITHDVAMDAEGPALAAVLLAGLLEGNPNASEEECTARLLGDLCAHARGRRGTTPPSGADLRLAVALEAYLETGFIRGKRRQRLIEECAVITKNRQSLKLTGNPADDWLAVRALLLHATDSIIQNAADDAKYVRLLRRGAVLRANLSDIWRRHHRYEGAADAVRSALLQEHFSSSLRVISGVLVMTIHKSKGKEFNEVFVYEGTHYGRIIPPKKDIGQARLALRVAATRAKERTTILTPENNSCRFLR